MSLPFVLNSDRIYQTTNYNNYRTFPERKRVDAEVVIARSSLNSYANRGFTQRSSDRETGCPCFSKKVNVSLV